MFDIIGKKIKTADYLADSVSKMKWTPKFVTLHNTAVPKISDRPSGFNEQSMKNLLGYYAGMGWSGGPHFFVDQTGVWAFNPITKSGVHSPSWNKTAIGVEMLGDYNAEAFNSGDGLKIQNNTMQLLADLCVHFGFDPSTIKLHKEDPKTDHDCPGKNVVKSDVIAKVTKLCEVPTKIIIYRKGMGHDPAGIVAGVLKDNRNFALVSDIAKIVGFNNGKVGLVAVADVLGAKYTYAWHEEEMKLYCVEK